MPRTGGFIVSGFSADWLALRESSDAAARSRSLADDVLERIDTGRPVRIIDLATGTGANVRYLAPLIHQPQAWSVIDHDRALLTAFTDRMRVWAAGRKYTVAQDGEKLHLGLRDSCIVVPRVVDLARDLDNALVAGAALVTTSALLDLVSETWLARLIGCCRDAGACVFFALNYDGRVRFSPPDRDDEFIIDIVNRHQRRDKGFGPALGPTAAERTLSLLVNAGYDATTAASDWQLDRTHRQLQMELVNGWAQAAMEQSPESAATIRAWQVRRMGHVADAGTMIVGHQDVAGWFAG